MATLDPRDIANTFDNYRRAVGALQEAADTMERVAKKISRKDKRHRELMEGASRARKTFKVNL